MLTLNDVKITLGEEAHILVEVLDMDDLYAVGGVVRDFVFNFYHHKPFEPKDIDFACSATPDEVLAKLRSSKARALGIGTIEVGKSFGVVKARFPSGTEFEIATFRDEFYDPNSGDGRRPDAVKFIKTPEGDARRRDLTINGLFYNIRKEQIEDYVEGLKDIQEIRVRPIGDPRERFREDRLRVMRLARFFCRYHLRPFNEEEGETVVAVREFAAMDGVSHERIVTEFKAGLKQSLYPPHYLAMCEHLKLLPAMFGEGMINKELLPLTNSRNHRVALAILLQLLSREKDLMRHLNSLCYEDKDCKIIAFLIKLLDFDAYSVYHLWKKREAFVNQKSLRQDVAEFCNLRGLNKTLMERFMEFRPQSSAADFPDKEGRELGLAIEEAANREFAECNT